MPGAATGAAPQATADTKKKPPGGSRKGRRNHSQGVVKAGWSQDQIVAHKKKLDREAAKRYRARCKARKEAEAEAARKAASPSAKPAPRQSLPASPVVAPKRKRAVSPTFDDDDESGDETEEELEAVVVAQALSLARGQALSLARGQTLTAELKAMWQPIFERLTSTEPLEDILIKDATFNEQYVSFVQKYYEQPHIQKFVAAFSCFVLPSRDEMLEDMTVAMFRSMQTHAANSVSLDHTNEETLAAARGACSVSILYNRKMCGLHDDPETRRELRQHGHVPDAVFRGEGKEYVGKSTAIMASTCKLWTAKAKTNILIQNKEWRCERSCVEDAAAIVEARRHYKHTAHNAEVRREGKITSFDTANYDDFCGDSLIEQHMKLTGLAVCPLSGVRGFAFAADYLVLVAEKREVSRRDLVNTGLNGMDGGSHHGKQPECLKGVEVHKKRVAGTRAKSATKLNLQPKSLRELKALRPRRPLQRELEETAEQKGISVSQADPFHLKYYDDYGRCTRYSSKRWNMTCTGSNCIAVRAHSGRHIYENGKRKTVNGPTLTGFNRCHKCPEPQ